MYEKGELVESGTYNKNQVLEGEHIRYILSFEGKLKVKEYYTDGTLEGKKEAHFVGTGNLYSVEMYKNGVLNGPSVTFYENGLLKTKSKYIMGELDGKVKQWNEKGQLVTKEFYKNGKEIHKEKKGKEKEGIEKKTNDKEKIKEKEKLYCIDAFMGMVYYSTHFQELKNYIELCKEESTCLIVSEFYDLLAKTADKKAGMETTLNLFKQFQENYPEGYVTNLYFSLVVKLITGKKIVSFKNLLKETNDLFPDLPGYDQMDKIFRYCLTFKKYNPIFTEKYIEMFKKYLNQPISSVKIEERKTPLDLMQLIELLSKDKEQKGEKFLVYKEILEQTMKRNLGVLVIVKNHTGRENDTLNKSLEDIERQLEIQQKVSCSI